jgi:uncharacterized membrane protein YeaQ/YmgE (transglycosylase-associated protein family)
MWLFWEILVGLAMGWLASQLIKRRGLGLPVDMILGAAGCVLGGGLSMMKGLAGYGMAGQLVVGEVCAIILLTLTRIVKHK